MSVLRRMLVVATLLAAVLGSAAAQAGDKLVFIVRHAEKASATDPDSPLSDAGRARAAALASALRDANLTDVLVTSRMRTQQTAAPAAALRSLTAHVVPLAGTVPEHVAAVAAAVRATKGNAVLVVGHSNTVPLIIAALGAPKVPDLCDPEYANLFIVRVPAAGAPTLVRAQYGAPDAPDAASCAAASMK